jgi:hypothetical protein
MEDNTEALAGETEVSSASLFNDLGSQVAKEIDLITSNSSFPSKEIYFYDANADPTRVADLDPDSDDLPIGWNSSLLASRDNRSEIAVPDVTTIANVRSKIDITSANTNFNTGYETAEVYSDAADPTIGFGKIISKGRSSSEEEEE